MVPLCVILVLCGLNNNNIYIGLGEHKENTKKTVAFISKQIHLKFMKSTKTKSKQTMAKGEDKQRWRQTNLLKGRDLSSPFFYFFFFYMSTQVEENPLFSILEQC
jgi:hypothetical protein